MRWTVTRLTPRGFLLCAQTTECARHHSAKLGGGNDFDDAYLFLLMEGARRQVDEHQLQQNARRCPSGGARRTLRALEGVGATDSAAFYALCGEVYI